MLVGWLLLGAFYVQIPLRRALVIHCFAPVIVLVFLFIGFVRMLDAGQLPDARDIQGPLEALAICCLVSSLFSLPSYVLMMIVWALARDRPEIR